MTMGNDVYSKICQKHKMFRVNGKCHKCENPKHYQPLSAIDVAKIKLPNPTGMKLGRIVDIEVTSLETGISSSEDECIGVEHFKFILGSGGWELVRPNLIMGNDLMRDESFKPTSVDGLKGPLQVVPIKPSEHKCGENVVQRLEEALALAKEGKIDNLVIVAVGNDGCNYDAWANGRRPFEMMGALESVKLDFFNTMTDRRG